MEDKSLDILKRITNYMPDGIAGRTLVVFILFLIWISLFKVDVLVKGIGVIRVESRNLTLQHPEGGVIQQLLVHEGQQVTEGQLIAIVDNSYVNESYAKNEVERKALLVKVQRLHAELSGEKFEPQFTGEKYLDEIITSESSLFESRSVALQAQKQVNSAQVEQKKAQILELATKIDDLSKQAELAKQEVQLYKTMVTKGAAAQGSLLQKKLEYQQIQTALNEARLKIPRLNSELSEYEARYEQIQADFISDVQKQLTQVNTDLSRVDALKTASEERRENSKIVSPVDGVIQRLFVAHKGAVIRQGGEVVEIAPSKVPLIAEVRVRPEDRDRIWENMVAKLHVSAFDVSYANTLEGKVSVISADALSDENIGRYYLVSIEVPAEKYNVTMYPGMSVDAYLLTGKRTLLEYFLKPLLSNSSLIFSEP
ncbi:MULTISPECIES: HlyD family type I secretion periplasmic adaptor subunit [unclassified Gilliamella]|uniref:HlyD family type I secretion periplasmic adaptor subunit n=1 Tax=unclassified Gilliamella TaxID=2685620 RepID=UPI0009B801C7|nr:HlyD family type I secretion periplasmic adaptor subunit [Gilliamella apicola]